MRAERECLFGLLSPIRLVVGIAGIDDGMGARTGFPVGFALQIKFHSVDSQNLLGGIIAPRTAFPDTFGDCGRRRESLLLKFSALHICM